MKKFVPILCILTLFFALVACSDSSKINKDKSGMSNEEIEQKYDEYFGDGNTDTPLTSDASVLGEDFSAVDFTFTSADDTEAFNLGNNTYAKITAGGTVFGGIAPGSDSMNFASGYKTARGAGLETNAKDILKKYKIADANALFVGFNDDVLRNPANGNFEGKLTVVYASTDSVSYGLLSSDNVEEFIYVRNANMSGDHINNPQSIMNVFSAYESIVSVDITADESGNVTEIAFYKFDK